MQRKDQNVAIIYCLHCTVIYGILVLHWSIAIIGAYVVIKIKTALMDLRKATFGERNAYRNTVIWIEI